ncbi:MAG: leader peptidase (prepilin peptidase)/N-methyltransferase [Pirellulaceae bacterium]|jgi:leader peptidase (prepilin peptidase)/N-methyltransferase
MFLSLLPSPLDIVITFVVGAIIGGQVNRGIYRLAIEQSLISPWSATPEGLSVRSWLDRIPIIGWFRLQRESKEHGDGFWLRPLLIELGMAVGLAYLYVCEMDGQLSVSTKVTPDILEAQYLVHVLLISLMMVATFIDFDEKTIPDAITVPGTLIGLILVSAFPAVRPLETIAGVAEWVIINSPKRPWPDSLSQQFGLAIGCMCFAGWCLAIMPKTVTLKRGPWKAVQYLLASSYRYGKPWMLMAVVGCAAIGGAWYFLRNTVHWEGLLTGLVGMAFAGGLIWAVRIIGWVALRKEAMGFGDVTLMAMIGVYLGWQSSILIFFMAPFSAVFISLMQWLLTGKREIAFGPYLCLGTLFIICRWPGVWDNWAKDFYVLGWYIPKMLACSLLAMGGMLSLWRLFESWLYPD